MPRYRMTVCFNAFKPLRITWRTYLTDGSGLSRMALNEALVQLNRRFSLRD
jgi:hypothetical protein